MGRAAVGLPKAPLDRGRNFWGGRTVHLRERMVVGRYAMGRSVEEICRIMELKPATVLKILKDAGIEVKE